MALLSYPSNHPLTCHGPARQVCRPGKLLNVGPMGMSINQDMLLDLRVIRDK